MAFLDSGFYPHPDLLEPESRILAYHDLAQERPALNPEDKVESWQWAWYANIRRRGGKRMAFRRRLPRTGFRFAGSAC